MAADALNTRMAWGALGLVALAVVCIASQAKAQLNGETSSTSAATKKSMVDLGRRGLILSSDGEILAESYPAFEIRVHYPKIPRSPGFFAELSAASGIPFEELERPLAENEETRNWRPRLGAQGAEAVRKVRGKWLADGLSLEPIVGRDYPLGPDASGVVGYTDDRKGLFGVESGQESGLMTPGTGGHGETVTLTIDSDIQIAASQALRAAIEQFDADSGSAVVMDPSTGRILAMANAPVFQPEGTIAERSGLNQAYQLAYEPGSTFKVLTLAKALDMGVVGEGFSYSCGGAISVGGKSIRCSHVHHGVGLDSAIAQSCNGAAIRWGQAIGHSEYIKFMHDLHITDRVDLGMSRASAGLLANDPSKVLQLATLSFGQSINVTPVRLCSAFSVIANGGTLMEPQMIQQVGETSIGPVNRGRILSQETCDRVMEAMAKVIESDEGTGKHLRLPGVRLAGKTGTAQKTGGGRVGGAGYVASFVGFVPAHKPRAVVLVMVDNPKGPQYYGGQVAGPVFTEIARAILRQTPVQRNEVDLEVTVQRSDTGTR
ncbi:MAG: penicillin-binding protein 2 [Fimbriimonadaceae bacterium]|nr:penicillin-binding protein 2 [Fimbriimonadaceae bacterium]